MAQGDVVPTVGDITVIILPGEQQAIHRTRRAIRAHDLTCGEPNGGAADNCWWWVIRAGCWPFSVPCPQASASGRVTALIGMAIPAEEGAQRERSAETWDAWSSASGGDADVCALPGLPPAVLLDPRAVDHCRKLLSSGMVMSEAVTLLLSDPMVRRIRWRGADVAEDERVRVAQVITSLQRGGAERMALSLHQGMPSAQFAMQLIVAGEPTRGAFPMPVNSVACSDAGSRPQRMAEAACIAARAGCDVVHAHLLTGDDLLPFRERDLPLMVTVHNSPAGWPAGLLEMNPSCLLVACSRRVEADLARVLPNAFRRTVWNGIDVADLMPTPERTRRGCAVRGRLGIDVDDIVLVALANPRAQKRLELIPAMVAPLARLLARRVQVVLAGEGGIGPGAAEAEKSFSDAVAQHGVGSFVHRLGMVTEVAEVLAAADLLVSPSAWEGLSLAHLEALAAGIPVVASDVGGAAEVAYFHDRMHVLPKDAATDVWVNHLAAVLRDPPKREMALHQAFTSAAMARGYARLYARVATMGDQRTRPQGLWLVTNNLSTGGAQSSARRLLHYMQATGVKARCALLQEREAQPTPGRRDLIAAGIHVCVIPPPERLDVEASVAELVSVIEHDPPQAVLLWNVMPAHKLILAETLFGIPLWDVSPGEMNFASLERVFRKLPLGLSLRDAADYGARLAGSIVKYHGEYERASSALGCAVHVVLNGVPIPLHPVKPSVRDCVVFGTATRLSPDKRLDDLIDALRLAAPRLPSWEMRILGGPDGDPAYAERLRAQCVDLPVRFLGEVAGSDEFLADLDLFVLIAEPAGCPNASLEAMAHGLAVVATKVGGMEDQITSDVEGLLVPPRDPEALAHALILAAHDPQRRARWGAAARQRIATHFTVARMVADYRRICLPADTDAQVTPP